MLGQCTACSRRVYSRADHPDTPEWYRPASKGPLRPHRHDPTRIGTCSLCSSSVYLGGDGIEKVKVAGKSRPHRHKKPFEVIDDGGYRIVPVREEEPYTGPQEMRGWEIHADWMGAL